MIKYIYNVDLRTFLLGSIISTDHIASRKLIMYNPSKINLSIESSKRVEIWFDMKTKLKKVKCGK